MNLNFLNLDLVENYLSLNFLKYILANIVTAVLGWFLVGRFGKYSKTTQNVWLLTVPLLITPVVVYIIMKLSTIYLNIDGLLADSFAFGSVIGIVIKLSSDKPIEASVAKLIVYDMHGKTVEITLEIDALVGDARNKIAEAFKIQPASRVLLETGKGGFIEDLKGPLIPALETTNADVHMDFFGKRTFVCYVQIKDETPETDNFDADKQPVMQSNITSRNLMSMLNSKAEVKYGADYILLANHPASAVTANVKPFYPQLVDKFLAATVSQQSNTPLRIEKWTNYSDSSDLASEVGSANLTPSIKSNSASRRPVVETFTSILKLKPRDDSESIHDGDLVVFETQGKYLSVTRGWWLAWNSPTPRRSGAFVVEVLERVPRMQNLMSMHVTKRLVSWPSISLGTAGAVGMDTLHGMGAINTDPYSPRDGAVERRNSQLGGDLHSSSGVVDSRGSKDHSVLHLGDVFRLRSVKFPDYELGITSEHVRGDFCYLGLRKVSDKEKDTWCVPLRFSLKAPDLFTSRDRSKVQPVQPVNPST